MYNSYFGDTHFARQIQGYNSEQAKRFSCFIPYLSFTIVSHWISATGTNHKKNKPVNQLNLVAYTTHTHRTYLPKPYKPPTKRG